MKRVLPVNLDELLLIVETKGANFVPAISNGKSYDYFLTIDEIEGSRLGFLNDALEYSSFEDFEKRYFETEYSILIKEYDRANSKEYFDATKSLAEEFNVLTQQYKSLMDSTIAHSKKSANPIYKTYLSFLDNHPELSKIDIRFAHMYVNVFSIDESGKQKLDAIFYDPNPLIDFETYKVFINKYVSLKKKQIQYDCSIDIEYIKTEFSNIKEKIEELLITNNKVGLIRIQTRMSKRFKEVEELIQNFNINSFLSYSNNVIYWFHK